MDSLFQRKKRNNIYKKIKVKNMTSKVSKPVDNSKIVLPGELVQKGIDYLAGQGTYRDGESIKSKYLGILKKQDYSLRVIPLSGEYVPAVGDFVIGEIEFVSFMSWKIYLSDAYKATLPVSMVDKFIEKGEDLSNHYKRGDLVFVRIDSISRDMDITLSMKDRNARKLFGGRIIRITSAKVPRVIGKKGTMVGIIKEKTGCTITVGQNGLIWVKGENEDLVAEAIDMIDKHSHESGLTDRVAKYLDSKLAKTTKTAAKTTKKAAKDNGDE